MPVTGLGYFDGAIYHTYSAYARGDERSLGTYMWLDITPKGRNEGQSGNLTNWVKRHDEYDTEPKAAASPHEIRKLRACTVRIRPAYHEIRKGIKLPWRTADEMTATILGTRIRAH